VVPLHGSTGPDWIVPRVNTQGLAPDVYTNCTWCRCKGFFWHTTLKGMVEADAATLYPPEVAECLQETTE